VPGIGGGGNGGAGGKRFHYANCYGTTGSSGQHSNHGVVVLHCLQSSIHIESQHHNLTNPVA
jgi:hypothetical protein